MESSASKESPHDDLKEAASGVIQGVSLSSDLREFNAMKERGLINDPECSFVLDLERVWTTHLTLPEFPILKLNSGEDGLDVSRNEKRDGIPPGSP